MATTQKDLLALRVKQLRLKYGDDHPEVKHYAAQHGGLPPIKELVFGEPGYGVKAEVQKEVGVEAIPPPSLGRPVFKAPPVEEAKAAGDQTKTEDKPPNKPVDAGSADTVKDTA